MVEMPTVGLTVPYADIRVVRLKKYINTCAAAAAAAAAAAVGPCSADGTAPGPDDHALGALELVVCMCMIVYTGLQTIQVASCVRRTGAERNPDAQDISRPVAMVTRSPRPDGSQESAQDDVPAAPFGWKYGLNRMSLSTNSVVTVLMTSVRLRAPHRGTAVE
jgi:hypothetical protein